MRNLLTACTNEAMRHCKWSDFDGESLVFCNLRYVRNQLFQPAYSVDVQRRSQIATALLVCEELALTYIAGECVPGDALNTRLLNSDDIVLVTPQDSSLVAQLEHISCFWLRRFFQSSQTQVLRGFAKIGHNANTVPLVHHIMPMSTALVESWPNTPTFLDKQALFSVSVDGQKADELDFRGITCHALECPREMTALDGTLCL